MDKINYGYTTGSSAAAACKIAVKTLFTGQRSDYIKIDTPKGWILTIDAHYTKISPTEVDCFVFKDFSDDPDVTKGIKICVNARKVKESGISIKAGIGIGIVTKKGLRVAVGNPAINPVPMEMILREIRKVLPENCGVEVTISVPEGEEVAKKTFNSKLGIIGGISILGTTGIVEPMSEDAFKESLKLELNVKKNEKDRDMFIFVFGNFGRDFLRNLNVNDSGIHKTSNFIGYMMEAAAQLGIKKILLVGHAGKMVKVANGMYNTHSKYGDGRMESIVKSCTDFSEEERLKILQCNTTDEAVEYLKDIKRDEAVFQDIGNRCKTICENWSGGKVEVQCVIFTTVYGQVSSTRSGMNWLKEMVL